MGQWRSDSEAELGRCCHGSTEARAYRGAFVLLVILNEPHV